MLAKPSSAINPDRFPASLCKREAIEQTKEIGYPIAVSRLWSSVLSNVRPNSKAAHESPAKEANLKGAARMDYSK